MLIMLLSSHGVDVGSGPEATAWTPEDSLICRYLGLYEEEVDAAKAYDVEAIKRRGVGAVTNFDLSSYIDILGKRQAC